MSMKTAAIAFSDGNTTFIKETRDSIDSSWFMINNYKTVRGYTYEQVLQWAVQTKAKVIYTGEPIILNLKSYEDYQMSNY